MDNRFIGGYRVMINYTIIDGYFIVDEEKIESEIFDKIKKLETLENSGFVTVEMAANYYDVGKAAIEKIIKRNRQELKEFDIIVHSYKQLIDMFDNVNVPSRGLTLIPIKGMLKIGTLLCDSEIARLIRERLLEVSPQLYHKLMPENTLRFKKYEEEMGNYLEFSFGKYNVKRQVRCGKYYLDFVLFNKYNIEVDEYGHCGYDDGKEIKRENYISQNTDYITIRYNPQTEMPYMLMAKILKEMEGVEYEI